MATRLASRPKLRVSASQGGRVEGPFFLFFRVWSTHASGGSPLMTGRGRSPGVSGRGQKLYYVCGTFIMRLMYNTTHEFSLYKTISDSTCIIHSPCIILRFLGPRIMRCAYYVVIVSYCNQHCYFKHNTSVKSCQVHV